MYLRIIILKPFPISRKLRTTVEVIRNLLRKLVFKKAKLESDDISYSVKHTKL